jgi:hypothetical protein
MEYPSFDVESSSNYVLRRQVRIGKAATKLAIGEESVARYESSVIEKMIVM